MWFARKRDAMVSIACTYARWLAAKHKIVRSVHPRLGCGWTIVLETQNDRG